MQYEKIISILVTIIGSFIPIIVLIRNWNFNSREKLKNDLEILSKFDPNDESSKTIKKYIDNKVKETYTLQEKYKFKLYHPYELLGGIIYTLITCCIAIYSYNDNTVWWIISVLYLMNGPLLILSSFLKKSLIIISPEDR